jgi:hypothetical protein
LFFRYIYRRQLVDIIIPENAYRIVFTVLNVVLDMGFMTIFYSNLPIKSEVTRKVDKSIYGERFD